jgi:hypothetical protein
VDAAFDGHAYPDDLLPPRASPLIFQLRKYSALGGMPIAA